MNRVILCGGCGYIGTRLTEKLLEKTDFNIIIIDRLDFILNGDFKEETLKNPRIKLYQKDIREIDFLSKLIQSSDIVINLAALVGEPLCNKKPQEALEINRDAAIKLVDICHKKNVDKFIQFSTCSNYGKAKEPVDENGDLFPTSIYARSKVELERYLKNIPNCIVLRCATAYGFSRGRMRFDLLLNEFVKDGFMKGEIIVFQPQVHRPLVHVDDICKAVVLIIKQTKKLSQVYNVGTNAQNYTKGQIAKKVAEVLDARLKIIEKPDNRDYIVKFDKIKEELGFSTDYSIDDGILQMLTILKQGNIKLNQSNVQ